MADIIELGEGPYVVKTNSGGGIEFAYGWSELHIENGTNIRVICTNDSNITRTILKFNINNRIPREYKILEKIQIYLKRGFNSIYAYNYSDVNKFNNACKLFFRNLDEELSKKNDVCDKCNGTSKL